MTVTLDGAANDGEGGESDNADVENVTGGSAADSLTGDATANLLTGAGGDGSLAGGVGDDSLSAGAGADSLVGDAGDDVLAGGAGTDIADYSSRAVGVSVTLDGAANDGEAGETDDADVENVTGGGATTRSWAAPTPTS